MLHLGRAPVARLVRALSGLLAAAFLVASFGAARAEAPAPAKPKASASKAAAETKPKAVKKAATAKASEKSAKKKKHVKHVAEAKPKRRLAVTSSANISKADLNALTDAFNEADRKNWPEAMRHMARLSDPVAAKLVLWTRLIAQDSGATLAEITDFQEKNPDWPRQAVLSVRAEEALLAYPSSNESLLTWFAAHPPQTGEGKIRYGQALIAAGRGQEGGDWIRRAWVENDFSQARQRDILANFRATLTPATQRARLDRLLSDQRTDDAKAMAALLGADARALTDARIRLMTGSSLADDALSRVPSSLKGDPGLLFDRIRYERRRGNNDAVLPLILTAPDKPHQMLDPDAWWIERKIAARKALAQGRYKEAYAIVSQHGLKSGSDFADAEFFSGWIALQYLNNPGPALSHFITLEGAVSTPISKARAEYWCARAASAQGNDKVAELYYRRASQYPTTFYGQLAISAMAQKSSEIRLHLPRDPQPTAADRANFKKLELVHAAYILHDLARNDQMWSFMLHLADILETPDQMVELADLAVAFDDPKLSLRVAKSAAQRNMVLPQRAYPVSLMPNYPVKGPPVEKALVYGLSRQESEFDPAAVSPVGARGLMQLMPATARHVARQISVPYSPHRLTSDPAYNAMLGSAHLGDLIDGYSGSYVMSVAAYNAGATRVSEWVGAFGDPRSTAVDPVDWIENIPFTETRNYVQRVMENLEIYRSRLAGSAQRIRLGEDIRRNTGSTISTPAPTPGKIPLASPYNSSGVMTPVADGDDADKVPDKDKDDQMADAADSKATPADTPRIPIPRTTLTPGHGGR
ncbi:MAG: lytic transglycosylase domain-containing protein [Parvibaculum sp.]|uniref:lytic transglycosylase domain-containing protein n=1 Tax=Parvibaculum sp. TaxID=2024848 RepID=UPI00284EF760|nr:lytic transglycosylase domain-containing protein [Parvibaculum sp.]MDR3499953.1 lytic transglycosylase domain-containing protein [Parvibaculum sp.]